MKLRFPMKLWRAFMFSGAGAMLLLACNNEIIVQPGSSAGTDTGTDTGTSSGTSSGTASGTTSGAPSGVGSGAPSGVGSGAPSGAPSGSPSGSGSGSPSGTATGTQNCFMMPPQQCYECVCNENPVGCQNYTLYLAENLYCGMGCAMSCDPFCQTLVNGFPDFNLIDGMCQSCFDSVASMGGPDVDAFFADCQADAACIQLLQDFSICG